ncbi:hypothetical protein [Pseudomarimonas arenosa]|uniref:Uncharacterized protein n=1 Tax=Pseudomarimonas arenosa TaxID=2774145 RepID=A0AAW3ZRS4_9GAMM|nr:hypothetical protein [Pseudomarimonas arenosa]MBD8527802.1 hypothetical protein [Pseudomarimonas arenosa]
MTSESELKDQQVSQAIPRLLLRDAFAEIQDEWLRADRGLPRTVWRLTRSPRRALDDWIVRRDHRSLGRFATCW